MDGVCGVGDRDSWNQWLADSMATMGTNFGYATQGAGQTASVMDQLITGAKVKAGCFPTTS